MTVDFEKALWGAFCTVPPEAAIAGLCIPLEPGRLEKGAGVGIADCVHHWSCDKKLHQSTYGVALSSARDNRSHFRESKTRSYHAATEEVCPLHRRDPDKQQSMAPKCWNVFMLSVRTNNDIEGWHDALNWRAAGSSALLFYLLVSALHNEARLVSLQIWLVSERKLKRIRRAAYRQLQSWFFELWEAFNKREKSLKQLPKVCANISRPMIV